LSMSTTSRAVLDTLASCPGMTPTMRVIECNECGETVSAANDQELATNLAEHLRTEHELEPDEEEITDLVHDEAYDATDS
jgi:predicted small metal-binding protein